MSDYYYQDGPPVRPPDLVGDRYMAELGYQKWNPVCLWECFSGSAALSTAAKEQGTTHLPPVDHRYGFHMGRFPDQLAMLYTQIVYGTQTLQGSPNCWPWGNNSRGWPREQKARARRGEALTLRFWVIMCFLQVVMGRPYLNEQPKAVICTQIRQ